MSQALRFPSDRLLFKISKIIGIDAFLARRLFYKQLLSRTFEDYCQAWGPVRADHVKLHRFCEIIKEEMEWPNAYFFPTDSFNCLLIHSGMGMEELETLFSIEHEFHCTEDLIDRINGGAEDKTVLEICRMLVIAES